MDRKLSIVYGMNHMLFYCLFTTEFMLFLPSFYAQMKISQKKEKVDEFD